MSLNESSQESKTDETSKENIEILEKTFEFIPKGIHSWKQQGPYLICSSCELQHAVWIGVSKWLVGFEEDGSPKLVDSVLVP